jgi:hypothetical protein
MADKVLLSDGYPVLSVTQDDPNGDIKIQAAQINAINEAVAAGKESPVFEVK